MDGDDEVPPHKGLISEWTTWTNCNSWRKLCWNQPMGGQKGMTFVILISFYDAY